MSTLVRRLTTMALFRSFFMELYKVILEYTRGTLALLAGVSLSAHFYTTCIFGRSVSLSFG